MRAYFPIRSLVFFLLTFLHLHLSAQPGWRSELDQVKGQHEKIQWLFAEAKKNTAHRLPVLKEALKLTKEIHSDTLEAKTYHKIGYYYMDQGDMPRSWEYYEKAKALYLKAGAPGKTTMVLYNQSELLVIQYLADSLVHFIELNKKLIDESEDSKHRTYLKVMYANGFIMSGNHSRAKEEFVKIMPVAEATNDTPLLMSTSMNIAKLQNSLDSTRLWCHRALSYGKSMKSAALYPEIFYQVGFLYYERNDALHDSALYYFMEAEKYIDQLNPVYQVELLNIIGNFFSSKNEPSLALSYYRKAYQRSEGEVSESTNIAVNNLALAFIRAGEQDSAAYYLAIYRKDMEKAGDNSHQQMIYYETSALYEMMKGDSCAYAVIDNYDKAISLAIKTANFDSGKDMLLKVLHCLNGKSKVRPLILASTLQRCAIFYQKFSSGNDLSRFSEFLEAYADLEYAHGSRGRSLDLYRELSKVLSRMNREDYMKGIDEAVVKYKSDLKDSEIALLTQKQEADVIRSRLFTLGLFAVALISVLIFILYKREKKSSRLLDERNHKVEQLLREVHHRVKNNLQIVTSFINIQLDKIKDPEAKQALADTSTRIMALAGLHQSLYRQDDLSHIQLAGYIGELCEQIGHNTSKNVHIRCELENLELNIDQAIPVGLAVNELITNALKHAFTQEGEGQIVVKLSYDKQWELMVKDNGRGLPEDVKPWELESIGIRLVQDITETQLKGKFSFYNDGGAVFKIEFSPQAA